MTVPRFAEHRQLQNDPLCGSPRQQKATSRRPSGKESVSASLRVRPLGSTQLVHSPPGAPLTSAEAKLPAPSFPPSVSPRRHARQPPEAGPDFRQCCTRGRRAAAPSAAPPLVACHRAATALGHTPGPISELSNSPCASMGSGVHSAVRGHNLGNTSRSSARPRVPSSDVAFPGVISALRGGPDSRVFSY